MLEHLPCAQGEKGCIRLRACDWALRARQQDVEAAQRDLGQLRGLGAVLLDTIEVSKGAVVRLDRARAAVALAEANCLVAEYVATEPTPCGGPTPAGLCSRPQQMKAAFEAVRNSEPGQLGARG